MEKNEILANMYALRAGLSVVAINSDKIDKALGKAKSSAKSKENAARKAKDAVAHEIDKQREERKTYEQEMENAEKRKGSAIAISVGSNAVIAVLSIVCAVAGIAAFIYCAAFWVMGIMSIFDAGPFSGKGSEGFVNFIITIYGWLFQYMGNDSPGWFFPVTILATIASIGLGIGGLYMSTRIFGAAASIADDIGDGKDRHKTIKDCKRNIAQIDKTIQLAQSALASHDDNIKRVVADGKEEIAKTCKSLEPLSASTMAVYHALQASFSTFLDERDWGALDLLTYYIETGRADTVKESLQLLDRQKQTDQIVSAINEAAGAICRTVKAGLAALQNDMRKCFNILSDQISDVNSRVSAVSRRVASVECSVADQNAQISEMVSAASLNSALMAKANENSEKLLASAHACESNSSYMADALRQAQIGGKL